jgi:hypothetical protein
LPQVGEGVSILNTTTHPRPAISDAWIEAAAERRARVQKDVIQALFDGGFSVFGVIEPGGELRIVRTPAVGEVNQ